MELVKIHDELERRVKERTAELFVNERIFRILSQEFQTLVNASGALENSRGNNG